MLLIGASLLPVPGGHSALHAPLWVVLCAGLAFVLAGVAIMLQAFGRANPEGELPAQAPRWMRIGQYLIVFGILVCFGTIGSWIAFVPGQREFSGSFALAGMQVNASVGRVAFGMGAILVWVCAIAIAISGARKLCSRGKGRP